jgi:hypothetical protein
MACDLTFRKQPSQPRGEVLPQIPPITELIISLHQLYLVSSGQSELIAAAGFKVVCNCNLLAQLYKSRPNLCALNDR